MLIGSLRENLADFAAVRQQKTALTMAEIASCSRVAEEWFFLKPRVSANVDLH